MTAYFETLESFGTQLANTGIEVVDPGLPLNEWATELSYGPSWTKQPSIRKVVGFVARHLASTPLHLFEMVDEQDRRRVRTGPLAQLLRQPSRAPAMTPYRFWESILIDGLIHDKWCARIVQHDDGYELVRIPARMVSFRSDFLGRIEKVRITRADGQYKDEDPAEFLIDVGYAERGANGTSPLRTLRHILDEYGEAVAYRRSIWQNGARIPGVLERPTGAKWQEGAFDRFRSSWQNFVRGGGKEGGTPILEDGMTYREVNAFRPRDTLDLEGRKLTDIEVASSYYIAPELVGAREGTFANIKAFKQMLYGPNLGPYFDAWQQALNQTLVPLLAPGKNVYIEANIESKLRGSFEEQAEVLSTSIGAPWMTRNEGRALRNMPAIDGGDELITPLNVLVGGQASPQDGKAAAVISKFLERQEQVVRSGKSAGVVDWWDPARWDRELTDDLMKAGLDYTQAITIARRVNDESEQKYLGEGNRSEDEDE